MPKSDPFAVDEDNPALSDRQLAALKPASAVFTAAQLSALAAHRSGEGPPMDDREVEVKLRIAPDILAAFKAKGPGWQSRMHDALRRAIEAEG